MGLETTTYLKGLDSDFPIGESDFVSQGDDHIRLIKRVLQATFPNADQIMAFDKYSIKSLSATGSIPLADQGAFYRLSGSTADQIATLPASAPVGWCVRLRTVGTVPWTIAPPGSETYLEPEPFLQSSTKIKLDPGEGVKLLKDTDKWVVLESSSALKETDVQKIKYMTETAYKALTSKESNALYLTYTP